MKEKYGFVYIWLDKKHKRYYVGSHWGTEDDGYICSSRWMKNSYKRRPHDFKRRIISRIYSSKKDLLIEEGKWLSLMKPEELKGTRYYNINLSTKPGHWTAIPNYDKDMSEKLSSSIKAAHARPEVRENYIEGLKHRNTRSSDPEVRAKRSESMRRRMAEKFPDRKVRQKFGSEEYRENMRAKSLAMWDNPEHRERVGKKISAGLMGRPSPSKGTFWWNDGSANRRSAECPGDSWIRGKL